jgi:hypothetical protein
LARGQKYCRPEVKRGDNSSYRLTAYSTGRKLQFTMKVARYFLWTLSFAVFCFSRVEADEGDTNDFRLTYDKANGQALLYLNGTVVAQTQWDTPMSFGLVTGDFWIGRRMPGDSPGSWGYNCFFSGLLDEVAVYNRALSEAEIRAIGTEENSGEPLSPPTPNEQRAGFLNGMGRDLSGQ